MNDFSIRCRCQTAPDRHSACPCDLSSRWGWRSTGDQRSTGSWRFAPSSTELNRTGEFTKNTVIRGRAGPVVMLCFGLRINVCIFRYIFLFDKVVIVCKRKGYSYELKEIIELQSYKMSDDPMNNRDMKKVRAHLGWRAKRLFRMIVFAAKSPQRLTEQVMNQPV